MERSTRRKCLRMRMENRLQRMLRGASCGRSYDYDWRSTRDSRRSPWSCPWCRCRCRCRKINQISLHLSIHNMQLYCWGLPSEYGHGRVGFTVSGYTTTVIKFTCMAEKMTGLDKDYKFVIDRYMCSSLCPCPLSKQR